jgi:hypothetical protein
LHRSINKNFNFIKEKAMKVTKALILALTLAVPLSPISLVTADELLIKDNTKAFNNETAEHSYSMQKTVHIVPMNFADVVIVPPSLDEVVMVIDETAILDSSDVAFNVD